MDGFGSSALVAAVGRALGGDGGVVPLPDVGGAVLSYEVKRRYLADVVARYGLPPLLRVGRVLPEMRGDPAVSVLLAADGPADLFERWGRLERFTGSRNRVVLGGVREREVCAAHVGPPGAPPGPAADALVLGVLTASRSPAPASAWSTRYCRWSTPT
ncbi:hypothetical protein AB0469_03520 [Streptomyces sp. NPDC093801]|uniref:hypothetical protein n=1 Tax=Streptomyces sp. NPDC093801 TaxID=3155203 RepID=UPI003450361E